MFLKDEPTEERRAGWRQKLADFMRSQLAYATGKLRGRVVGNGPADDMRKARDQLPLFLQLFGVLPCFDWTQKARPLHARKLLRAGVDHNRNDWYRDAAGEWQRFPHPPKLSKHARKLGFKAPWRSPSLKPGHALKVEHAALVRAKLAE